MEDKFKKTEATLYNYKSLDTKIKNIEIDINNLENDITIKAISYDEKSSPTNAFNSSVENEVIRREEHVKKQIDILRAKLKYNSDLKTKIDGALSGLSDIELKLVELRYFNNRNKKSWISIGQDLGFATDHCKKLRNNIINYLSDLIYP
jgi:hypothetical protein